jgi:hypothetical protein
MQGLTSTMRQVARGPPPSPPPGNAQGRQKGQSGVCEMMILWVHVAVTRTRVVGDDDWHSTGSGRGCTRIPTLLHLHPPSHTAPPTSARAARQEW